MLTAPLMLTTCEASIQIDATIAPEYVNFGQEKMPKTIIMVQESPNKI